MERIQFSQEKLSQIDEKYLIKQILEGDHASFEWLIRKYNTLVDASLEYEEGMLALAQANNSLREETFQLNFQSLNEPRVKIFER